MARRKIVTKRVRPINYFKHAFFYSNYLKGKNIIIVGPSNILEGSKQGEEINNYDIVVRLNNTFPINPLHKDYSLIHEDIGNRTDVLYHTGAIMRSLKWAANRYNTGRIKLLDRDKIKWIVAKRDPVYGNEKEKRALNRFVLLNRKYVIAEKTKGITLNTVFDFFVNDLRIKLDGTEPNMSTIAIMHLLEFNIKSLRILGCDFYSGEYHKSYFIPDYLEWDNFNKTLIRKDGQKRKTPKVPHDYKKQIKFLLNVFENDKRVIIDNQIIDLWKEKLQEL